MTTSPEVPARRRRVRRLSSAAVILVALAATGLLYAALAPQGKASPLAKSAAATAAPAASDPADVEAGRQLFLQGCASCHGRNGEGGNRAPGVIGVGAAAVDFQVGTGRMPLQQHGAQAPRKKPAYNEEQIRQMAAYVASLGPGPAIPEDLNYEEADLVEGGALFRTNCSQCHNFAGSGGALTYGKHAPTMSGATPKQIYEAMITGPQNMPQFGDGVLTPDQKLAVIKYIEHMRAEPNPGGSGLGRIGPIPEGLVAWLAGVGLLVVATLWIGARA